MRDLDAKPESDILAIAKLKEAIHLEIMKVDEKEALMLEPIGEKDDQRYAFRPVRKTAKGLHEDNNSPKFADPYRAGLLGYIPS